MHRDLFDDEHVWFREAVAAFVTREIMPRREQARVERRVDREVWLEAGRHGFLGVGVPAEYGGAVAADFRFNAVLAEELARAGLAYASCFGIQTDVVAPYLIELTTAEQKQRWLPGFCAGKIVTAIAMTEPEAGSDLAAIRTTATPRRGGWVLTGSKTFITNGAGADLVIVAAKTAGAAGRAISLFAVEGDTPGFERGRKLNKLGQHEADTAELFFHDVEVPEENLIGRIGEGFAHMMERLPQERLSAACASVGHATAAVDSTLRYIRERRAFGRPIGSFQHSRFLMADLVTQVEVTQAYIDRCVATHARGELSPVDAAKAKWWSADVQNRVIDGCVQLFGGYGYMEEYDVARAWADARVTKVWAGSNEIMKEVIGRSLGLGEPRG